MPKIHKLTREAHKELDIAVSEHELGTIKRLIASNPGILALIDSVLLKTALYWFDSTTMSLLLSYNPDINYRDPQDFTILARALLEYNVEAIRLLLLAGATLDENHPTDKSAKSCALKRNPEIAVLLDKAARSELTSTTNSLASTETNSSDDEDHAPLPPRAPLSQILRRRSSPSTNADQRSSSIEMTQIPPSPASAAYTHPHAD